MKELGWRLVIQHAQADATMRDLLVRLLLEQDAAKHELQRRYGCTGMPWPKLVEAVIERQEDRQ